MRALLRPIEDFWNSQARGGFILFVVALLAFVIANAGGYGWYSALKETPLRLSFGDFALDKTLSSWVKDLLMSFFFLLVGLEIKREVVLGELSDLRRALLTLLAAIGGMIAPAVVYLLLNAGGPGTSGWGVPMATDIAFSLGVLSLLGNRVPFGLKVFLTAFAIADDLGAILIIAFFYSSSLNYAALLAALSFFVLALVAGRLGVRMLGIYMLLGAFMWFFMLKSGVSPTVAAVLLAMAIPLSRAVKIPELRSRLGELLRQDSELLEAELGQLERTLERAQSPLHRLEHLLHPWATYAILPVFAFFNAGVRLSGTGFGEVGLGAFLGLLLGKPLGIFLICWLAVRLGLAALPAGVSWPMILGAGFLGGIGFTMSLFVAALAFADKGLLDQAKMGVLSSSVVAAIVGLAVVSWAVRRTKDRLEPPVAD
ncbi:MAG: Na+/H+ antiporter NhaA [Thermaceae bacterium]|nr:Na+/H+ antiporter NhaA [Thermaceae bacterium]